MELLKGKPVADRLCDHIRSCVEQLIDQNVAPTLAILRVGENSSDIAYENSAVKKAESLGIHVEKFIMAADSSEEDVIDILKHINENQAIHGVLMFRPLPKHMDEDRVRNHLRADKDVDGITDSSMAGIFTGNGIGYPPCTAEAAMAILKYYGVTLAGKKAVVIGRSLVIGKPVAMMLMEQNATVTICHSRTPAEELKAYCREADVIVCAAGRINMLTGDCLTGKQVVIDVGINFDEEGKMCGDADFAGIVEASAAAGITPVPGGVGGVTTVLLLHHVVAAAMAKGGVSC
ncbi:MAG: bifunctional 5,10-methylenetetrahydrofolate dehydrogenase/5,10-methenyltetrahydrofolate cyclohydrolase [Firmicutes bacterium]|nr:bifunctional 5,10-methylenetetrahydrofolate dehydrogenase/5,10-methenyltetrahydrofolate cyclohydrolase [Bacillota bacterium]